MMARYLSVHFVDLSQQQRLSSPEICEQEQ